MKAFAGAAVAGRSGGTGRVRPAALARSSFPGLSAGDFSRGSLPGLSAAAGAARRQRDTSAMAGGGTAGCALQVSGGGRGRAGAGERRRWGPRAGFCRWEHVNSLLPAAQAQKSALLRNWKQASRLPAPELQEAISDYATSKEKDEYPDDFESDEDGMLNGIGKESNSGSTSTGRSVAGSPVLNDDALQKAVDLEKEAADDLSLSFHEKKLQQIMVLEDQDQKTVSTSDLKLEDNGRKSPSVDSSDGMMKITEEQKIADTMQEVSVNDQSEHREAKNTSKNSVKKLSETKERVLQNPKASLSDRSTTSVHLKRKGKAVPSTSPVSSQYLGSVKVLEDKCVQKKSPEFNKVDDLRAAVYQNWLEKKKLLLLELKRSEKEKAEILRSNTEKKEALKREESVACYEAWKKKKDKEARKLNEKKKLEELEEKKPAEQNKEKTEAAQAAFKKWKERKVEYLREQSRKEKQSEKVRKKIEEDLVAEKKRVSVSAVEKWNEKKEEYIKKKKVEKFLEKRKREMQQAKKEEKSEKAMEEYEKWLENKMRTEQLEKYQKKLQAVHGNEMSPPWRPPGKVTYSSNY